MQIKKYVRRRRGRRRRNRVKGRETFSSLKSILDSLCAVPVRHDAVTYTYSASENIGVF
jgi:hypothetical protein